jgi:DNA-binding CsgD family transcriptional regulator
MSPPTQIENLKYQNPWAMTPAVCKVLEKMMLVDSMIEVADLLNLSLKTVETQLSTAKKFMGIKSRHRVVLAYYEFHRLKEEDPSLVVTLVNGWPIHPEEK